MPSSGRPYRVFVSSTHDDLVAHREAAIAAIRGLDLADRAMETFVAEPGAPVAVCKARVRDCGALIVLLGHRYGWVPTKEQGGDGLRSITRIEVDEAVACGVPVFAFLVDPSAPWAGAREQDAIGPTSTLDDFQRVQRNLRELEAFRAWLEAHVTRRLFATPDDVRNEVTRSLARWLVEQATRAHGAPAPGPVGARPDECLRAYLDEVQQQNGTIRIQGIYSRTGAGRRALAFAIEDIYTPLTTSAPVDRDAAAGGGAPWGRLGLRERVPLTDVLARERRLLVVGQPGGGKTTFLKLVSAILARDALHADDARWTPLRTTHLGLSAGAPPPLPVFVRLSALAARMRTDGTKHPEDGSSHRWLLRALPEEARDVLSGCLDEGRCALLLDGLDEVTEPALRERVVALVDAVLHRWGDNLVVVTSRPHGYEAVQALRGVRAVHIDDFDEDDIRAFLARWNAGLDAGLAPDERASRAELEAAIVGVPHIRRMARNPVMLTSLCVIHWNEKALPEGKANLLAAVLRWLLAAREPNRREPNHTSRVYNNRFAERCFRELALAMTTGHDHEAGGKIATADLCWAAERLAVPLGDERGIDDPDAVRREGLEFLEGEMLWSGIVEKAGEGQLRFWHLTFQEHLAARALVDRSDEAWWALVKDHLHDRQWSEVLDHLAGCLAWTGERRVNLLVERILGTAPLDDLRATARVVGVLGRLVRILEVYDYAPPEHLGWTAARRRVMAIFTAEGAAEVPVADRIAAAEALGDNDPRFRAIAPKTLPIPGLTAADGGDLELGVYPVTVLEYRRFVQNDGYRDATWWADDWTLKQEHGWNEPLWWDEQLATPNRPVVGVSWHEAVAFCRWLSAVARPGWRLPSEAEWGAAATNPGGPYPWGGAAPDAERANYDQNVGVATPVGVYPSGAGPAGHLDLAGNVSEWCADDVSAEIRDWWDSIEGLPDERKVLPLRALRGGGWERDGRDLRAAGRARDAAVIQSDVHGFRVLLSPPSTGT